MTEQFKADGGVQMARKDAYHDIVKSALEKDGWTITSEPLRLVIDDVGVQIDLGAEQQPIAAWFTK